MGHHDTMEAPIVTTVMTFVVFTLVFLLGKLRDLFMRNTTKKGYAPLREAQEDFYQRRMFSRIRDCWNRPIASAPDAWIDVMDRTDISHSSGFKPLELTGTTRHCLNLGSYNYLGFAAADEYCTPRVQATLKQLGNSTCSPRIDAGTTPVHLELEERVAKFVGKPAAITFGMGYATNSATIPLLVGKGCLIISDQLNHASIVAGARGSGAKVKVFRHNNARHLDALLQRAIAEGQPRTHRPWHKILIIVEGVYSMEGEVCTLPDIIAVKKKYGAYLYLDEAHSIGALGAHGRGVCEHWGVDPADVDIMMGTFTKSFGSCGGYIAADRHVIDYLMRHSPAHLYATAMSPASVEQVLSAIKLLEGEDGTTRGQDKVAKLHANANYFRRKLLDLNLHVLGDWDSPVMPIMIYHPAKIPIVSRLCLERAVAMVVVGFPATAVVLTRARVCISAAHSHEDLDYALDVLSEVTDVCMMKYGVHTPLPPPRAHPIDPGSIPPPGVTAPGQRTTSEQPHMNGLAVQASPLSQAKSATSHTKAVTPNGVHGKHAKNGKTAPLPAADVVADVGVTAVVTSPDAGPATPVHSTLVKVHATRAATRAKGAPPAASLVKVKM